MKPSLPVPERNFRSNDFRYIPGFITAPRVEVPRDDLRREAAVWRVNRSLEDCAPSLKAYSFADVTTSSRLPVYIEYVLDSRNLFLPLTQTDRDDRARAKSDLGLNETDLRYVRRIRIEISNVNDYQVSEANLALARRDILSPSRCGSLFRNRRNAIQIDSALSGSVKVELETVAGVNIQVSDKLKGKIIKRIAKGNSGENVFFAARGRDLSLVGTR